MLKLASVKTIQAPPSGRHSARPRTVSGAHVLGDTLEMVGAVMSFGRNEEIYGDGEPADYLYKVVSGAVRRYKVLDDGRRQIGAFYLPGDMFGLEVDDEHASSTEAVSDTTVLVFKRSTVLAIANRDGNVARQLWGMTGRELNRAHEHALLLILSAQERVVSFLLEMADRLRSNDVELPMSRQDIADYLGLTIETVSRTLTQLEAAAAIAVPTARRIALGNRAALRSLEAY